MSLRISTTEPITGSLLIGDAGLGVLGSQIASSGDNGPGYAYNDLSLPADANKEICGRITTWPSAGTLFAYEDTSFVFSGAPDGAYSFQYQLYVDGAATGAPATVGLQVGASAAVSAAAAWTEVADSVAASGSIAGARTAAAAWTEQADAIAAGATVAGVTNAAAVWVEGKDAIGAVGAVLVPGAAIIDISKVPASRIVVFGGGARVVSFDVPFTGPSKGFSMTNAPVPYFKDGKWWVDKDPDEQSFYVANLTKELTDRATTAVSVEPIVQGVEVLIPPQIQGNFVVIKLGGLDAANNADNYWTARVTCANGERFDRTMWFNRVDN